MGYNIVCSDLLEDKNIEEGDDLVDFISWELFIDRN